MVITKLSPTNCTVEILGEKFAWKCDKINVLWNMKNMYEVRGYLRKHAKQLETNPGPTEQERQQMISMCEQVLDYLRSKK